MKFLFDEGNFRLSESYILRPYQDHAVAKNGTAGLPAGKRTRDPANLVQQSGKWAMKAIGKNLAVSSVYCMYLVVIPEGYNRPIYGNYTILSFYIYKFNDNVMCLVAS